LFHTYLVIQMTDETQKNVKLVYGVPEAGAMLGLSRNSSYAAAKRGDLPIIKIGKLIRVPKAAFDRMLSEAGLK
jgi:excisionase family DNA binding protein